MNCTQGSVTNPTVSDTSFGELLKASIPFYLVAIVVFEAPYGLFSILYVKFCLLKPGETLLRDGGKRIIIDSVRMKIHNARRTRKAAETKRWFWRTLGKYVLEMKIKPWRERRIWSLGWIKSVTWKRSKLQG
jgi:hypothetical protein